ncbi:hypothetical protein BN903_109 [Halorubrum sp. AJ67]|nr:hypothetical protein BN903_109 [Halorubrum sp. AJ67]
MTRSLTPREAGRRGTAGPMSSRRGRATRTRESSATATRPSGRRY